MKSSTTQTGAASHHALHEVLGGALGAIGSAGIGGVVAGPLGAFVGAIVGAGMGAAASWAAEGNAVELRAEDRLEASFRPERTGHAPRGAVPFDAGGSQVPSKR